MRAISNTNFADSSQNSSIVVHFQCMGLSHAVPHNSKEGGTEKILVVEMSRRNKITGGVLSEGNKNHQRQFKISADLFGLAVDKIEI
jgi:hypothetical protein